MPDADMVSLLRAVLDDVWADVAPSDTAMRQRVAASCAKERKQPPAP